MKITKRQLRQIVKEAVGVSDQDWSEAEYDRGYQDGLDGMPVASDASTDYDAGYEDGQLDDQHDGGPMTEASWGETADYKEDGSYFSDVIVMSPNGDSVLVDGSETYIQDVPQQLELMGFPMSDTDADNLIFALEDQFESGYVELSVTFENGKWSW